METGPFKAGMHAKERASGDAFSDRRAQPTFRITPPIIAAMLQIQEGNLLGNRSWGNPSADRSKEMQSAVGRQTPRRPSLHDSSTPSSDSGPPAGRIRHHCTVQPMSLPEEREEVLRCRFLLWLRGTRQRGRRQ